MTVRILGLKANEIRPAINQLDGAITALHEHGWLAGNGWWHTGHTGPVCLEGALQKAATTNKPTARFHGGGSWMIKMGGHWAAYTVAATPGYQAVQHYLRLHSTCRRPHGYEQLYNFNDCTRCGHTATRVLAVLSAVRTELADALKRVEIHQTADRLAGHIVELAQAYQAQQQAAAAALQAAEEVIEALEPVPELVPA